MGTTRLSQNSPSRNQTSGVKLLQIYIRHLRNPIFAIAAAVVLCIVGIQMLAPNSNPMRRRLFEKLTDHDIKVGDIVHLEWTYGQHPQKPNKRGHRIEYIIGTVENVRDDADVAQLKKMGGMYKNMAEEREKEGTVKEWHLKPISGVPQGSNCSQCKCTTDFCKESVGCQECDERGGQRQSFPSDYDYNTTDQRWWIPSQRLSP